MLWIFKTDMREREMPNHLYCLNLPLFDLPLNAGADPGSGERDFSPNLVLKSFYIWECAVKEIPRSVTEMNLRTVFNPVLKPLLTL